MLLGTNLATASAGLMITMRQRTPSPVVSALIIAISIKFTIERHTTAFKPFGSLSCSEKFLSEYSGFPLSTKTNIFPTRPQKLTALVRKQYINEISSPLFLVFPLTFSENCKSFLMTREVLWSRTQPSQGEAFSLRFDWVDPCDYPKCG